MSFVYMYLRCAGTATAVAIVPLPLSTRAAAAAAIPATAAHGRTCIRPPPIWMVECLTRLVVLALVACRVKSLLALACCLWLVLFVLCH